MNQIPWQDKNLIYKFPKGEWAGLTIEEVCEPWDLFLEACFLQTSFGDAFHVTAIKEKREVIFSIRDEKREPIADILTMPIKAKRYDPYWPKIRVLKTSHPMTIKEQDLIVLDVVSKNEKRASKECLRLAQAFYLKHNGVLDNEHPNGLVIAEGKTLKRWKKIWKGDKPYNLCIASKAAYINETQVQAFDLTMAISMLGSGSYNEIYMKVDEPWMDRVMDHLKENRPDRPVKNWRFFGDPQKVDEYIKLIKQWKNEEK